MILFYCNKGLSINDVTFGGRVGVSQKVTKSGGGGGGFGLLSQPKVTSFLESLAVTMHICIMAGTPIIFQTH